MRPDVRTFTKDNPCTKRDLWECFRIARGFRRVLVPEAHSIIGVNAPRVMERNGYLVRSNTPQGDYFELTKTGQDWLTKGILSYARNHPSEQAEIKFMPTQAAPATPESRTQVRRRRRT